MPFSLGEKLENSPPEAEKIENRGFPPMLPIIAIIGRPNVGKSTLFNRLVGGRRAITLDEPGVTRDRHYGEANWDGRDFTVIDTGGISPGRGGIEEKIRDQVDLAVEEAHCLLFVLDAHSGILPEEQEVLHRLRRSGKPLFFVINKIDEPMHEDLLSDFYALGDRVYPISAEHGYKVNDLLDAVLLTFPPKTEATEEKKKPIRLAVIGLPNVGKSSLLNRLLGQDRLVVHNEPGTTRDTIDTPVTVNGQDYLLIDTAGIRRKGKWSSKVERYSVLSSLKAVDRCDICLLVMDAKEGIHKQDAHVAGYAFEKSKALILVGNKWDLVKAAEKTSEKDRQKKFVEQIDDSLRFLEHAPILFLSAKTGEGCKDIWSEVKKLYEQCGRKIPTSEVNRTFESLLAAHNPPVYRGKPVKFYYATQTKTFPLTFLAFVNAPEGVHFSFKRYLINGFRKAFSFGGAPIAMVFRRKR